MDKLFNPIHVLILTVLIFMQKSIITAGNDSNMEGCVCPLDVYDPICASNNVTYSYSCYLKCAQKKDPSIKGVCYGECPCCKKRYDGDDITNNNPGWGYGPWRSVPSYWRVPQKGRIVPSYPKSTGQEIVGRNSNKNNGATAGIVVVEEIEGCPCAKIYKPVCGSDNVTYGNQCVFECQQENDKCLTKSCEGECPCCACNKVCDNKPPETGDSKSKYYMLER